MIETLKEKVKAWGQVTPAQGAALAKALLIIGLGLVTKPLLDMWPSIGSTITRGAIFAVAIILCLRMVQIMPSLKIYKPWFIPLCTGAFLNWLVVLANGGFMPSTCQEVANGFYIPMEGARLTFLGDWIFGFVSPGDVLMILAFVGIVATMVVKPRQRLAEQQP
jgi:hypothetical protein